MLIEILPAYIKSTETIRNERGLRVLDLILRKLDKETISNKQC